MLATLLPIRDGRERVVGYSLLSCPADDGRSASLPDNDTQQTLELIVPLSRLAGRSMLVPVTPGVVRTGALTRFASADVVWLIATDALDDGPTRKTVERLVGTGFQFALDGFPEGEPLPPSMVGSTIALDVNRQSTAILESRLHQLTEAGLRPLIRNVDDRVVRHRMLAAGVPMYTGRLLTRAASTPVDNAAVESALRALAMLASFADGRPPNASFDSFVRDDPLLAASMLRATRSAALGARGPRSVEHTLNLLGRDAVMAQLTAIAAFLLGQAAHDPELGFCALRRARVCEQIGAAIDDAPHPRARTVAGLLSVTELALGIPTAHLAERLQLSGQLQDAMLMRRQPLGQLLDLVDAMEYGWWDDLRSRCAKSGIATSVVGKAWMVGCRAAREELAFARSDAS